MHDPTAKPAITRIHDSKDLKILRIFEQRVSNLKLLNFIFLIQKFFVTSDYISKP
jgi:hypothetical protein